MRSSPPFLLISLALALLTAPVSPAAARWVDECCDVAVGPSCSINPDGTVVMRVDPNNAGGFMSSRKFYWHGIFSARMRITFAQGVPGGATPAFYFNSPGTINSDPKHGEMDFEFFKNGTADAPGNFILHTNLFAGGHHKLEQYKYSSFPPSNGFHTYTVQWNSKVVIWFLDSIPIRMTTRSASPAWPEQPLRMEASLWTRGDQVRDPVTLEIQSMSFRGCEMNSQYDPKPACASVDSYSKLLYPWNRRLNNKELQAMTFYQHRYTAAAYSWSK